MLKIPKITSLAITVNNWIILGQLYVLPIIPVTIISVCYTDPIPVKQLQLLLEIFTCTHTHTHIHRDYSVSDRGGEGEGGREHYVYVLQTTFNDTCLLNSQTQKVSNLLNFVLSNYTSYTVLRLIHSKKLLTNYY